MFNTINFKCFLVLEEGLKLKKKCKSLRNLLQETEEKRLAEQKEFEM